MNGQRKGAKLCLFMCIILLSFFTKIAQCMKNWIFERCANTQHICAVFAVLGRKAKSWTGQEEAVGRHGGPAGLCKMQIPKLPLGKQKSSPVTAKPGRKHSSPLNCIFLGIQIPVNIVSNTRGTCQTRWLDVIATEFMQTAAVPALRSLNCSSYFCPVCS